MGSSVDGFCLKYPRARPYIIPRNALGTIPREPVLTISIDALLLSHDKVSQYEIYNFLEVLFDNLQLLANLDPLLGHVSETFQTEHLNFPLHKGTRNFLAREEPSFFERYAELIGVIFSILVVLWGGISAFNRRLRRAKKDRIDVYYTDVLEIEKRIENSEEVETLLEIAQQVKDLKAHAFDQLIKERLIADESFRIFISLANESLALAERKIQEIS
jgi:hypothetical protein